MKLYKQLRSRDVCVPDVEFLEMWEWVEMKNAKKKEENSIGKYIEFMFISK